MSLSSDDRPIINPENVGLELDFGGRLLTIPFVQNQDMGHYYCIASNIVGDSQRHFKVNVQGELIFPEIIPCTLMSLECMKYLNL